MPKDQSRRPTDAELAVLQALWQLGGGTVRQVYEQLGDERDIGYTTVLKQLQIMTEKGLVVRDETVRPQVFRPKQSQKQTQRQLVRDLLDRVFAGSPANLVLRALPLERSSSEERQQIRQLLDELEGRSR